MNILTAFNSAANQYLKFAIVGFFGTIINLLVFYCLFNIFNTNFILNFLWTFKNTNLIASSQKKLFMYFKYLSVNLIGLLLNLLILNFVVHTFGDSVALMGQLAGILLGSISNFFFSRKLVF